MSLILTLSKHLEGSIAAPLSLCALLLFNTSWNLASRSSTEASAILPTTGSRKKSEALAGTYESTEYDGIDPKYFGGRAKEYKELASGIGDIGVATSKGMA